MYISIFHESMGSIDEDDKCNTYENIHIILLHESIIIKWGYSSDILL